MSFDDELRRAQSEHAAADKRAQDRVAEAVARPARYAAVASQAYAALVQRGAEVFALVREDAKEKNLARGAIGTVVFFDSWNKGEYDEAIYVDSRGGFHQAKSGSGPIDRRAKLFEPSDYKNTYSGGGLGGSKKLWKPIRMMYERIDRLRVLRNDDYFEQHELTRYPPCSPEEFEAYAARCVAKQLDKS